MSRRPILIAFGVAVAAAIIACTTRSSDTKQEAMTSKTMLTCKDGAQCTGESATAHNIYLYLDHGGKRVVPYCDSLRTVNAKAVWVNPEHDVTFAILNPESLTATYTLVFETETLFKTKKVKLVGKKKTRLKVNKTAETCPSNSGVVPYWIEGFKDKAPNPGVIVCPPGQTNC